MLVNGDGRLFLPWKMIPALTIGLVFDVGVASLGVAPTAILLAFWPRSQTACRLLVFAMRLALVPCSFAFIFVGAAELTFWSEFSSRFNFIAVDYLVYTNEVIGNIRQSYDLVLVFSAIATLSALLWWWTQRAVVRALQRDPPPLRRYSRALAFWVLTPVIAVAFMDVRWKEFSGDAQLDDLAGNGWFEFVHAYRNNEIDYDRFYKLLPEPVALAELAAALGDGDGETKSGAAPYRREVRRPGPEERRNVVLVSVESLSASFLGCFGDPEGLTPNLDRLAKEGLLFAKLYATGTRTVRGLEALTLSIPPTPGNSIVRRPDNSGLFTLGGVFRERGYESIFLYGGYGYFDNMNGFFAGNGYTVVDRTALSPSDITAENVWGVADEDLFRLAIRELDARASDGRKFFAHIMTTSNHRPFTYPAGRIDIPSGTSRKGAVKYSDWAIGNFIADAQKRPWFGNTLFVIVADHTHKGRGKTSLPLSNYHIPMIVYAPGRIAPGRVETMASQIDVAPTILGLLNFSYRSKFFGCDVLRDGAKHERALMANYQTVGYHEKGLTIELGPNRFSRVVEAESGQVIGSNELSRRLVSRAVAFYQVASHAFRSGGLKVDSP
jgi:phosphoglycerol transferase MdoB-like AlkP superfamily enzyme